MTKFRTKTSAASKSNSRSIEPLAETTSRVPMPEQWDRVDRYWHDNHLTEDLNADALTECVRNLRAAASAEGANTLKDLMDKATAILARATGLTIQQTQRFVPEEETECLHLHRNVLAAIAGTVALIHGGDPASVSNAIRVIPGYRGAQNRRACDDEILLCRIEAEYALAVGGRLTATAAKYLLTDAGAWPTETCLVRMSDLDLDSDTPVAFARGSGSQVQPRDLPLGKYHQRGLRRVLSLIGSLPGTSPDTTIAYTPTPGSTPGAISAAGTSAITIHYWNAGIRDATLKGSSVVRWRVARWFQAHAVSDPHLVTYWAGKTGKHPMTKVLTLIDHLEPLPTLDALIPSGGWNDFPAA